MKEAHCQNPIQIMDRHHKTKKSKGIFEKMLNKVAIGLL